MSEAKKKFMTRLFIVLLVLAVFIQSYEHDRYMDNQEYIARMSVDGE